MYSRHLAIEIEKKKTQRTEVVEKAGPLVVGGCIREGRLGYEFVGLLEEVAVQVVSQQQVHQHCLPLKV